MSLKVTFRRIARAEFIEATAWYEAQRPGLGVEFVAEIERCLALAAVQVVQGSIRRVTAKRFPFSVYFRVEPGQVVVLGVFHGKRDPAIWQGRR